MNVRTKPPTVVISPHQVAGEVDDVSGKVAERARAGDSRIEAPNLSVAVSPILQVAPPEVADLAELARLDHLPGQADGRYEAIVEGAHVLNPGRPDVLPDLVALVRRAAERLLADDMLAGLGGGDRRLCVHVVRAAVVEEADVGVGDDVAPVGRPALISVATGPRGNPLLVATGDRDEPWDERRWPGHVRNRSESMRVRLPHEGVAEHADADLFELDPPVRHRSSLRREILRLGSMKTSLGIWAFGPMITRFVPGGYQPEHAAETTVDRVRRAVEGLG